MPLFAMSRISGHPDLWTTGAAAPWRGHAEGVDLHDDAGPLTRGQYSRLSRPERRRRAAARRERRLVIAAEVSARYDGVARRRDLVAAGLTRDEIRAEVERGSWRPVGVHTLCVDGHEPRGVAPVWTALWETSSRAVLDGVSSLHAAGLTGFTWPVIEVSVPNNLGVRSVPGVRVHRLRDVGPVTDAGMPRTRTELAVVRAAQWAVSDSQAATVVAMSVQQRLVRPADLLQAWQEQRTSSRRKVLDEVIRDVCDGAHSLHELDFARLCRARGLPEPTRQAVRSGPGGRVYLDVFWEGYGLHVEIHGAHHFSGLKGVDDALRANGIALRDPSVVTLTVPVLGLRTRPDAFLDQVEQALATLGREAS